MNHPMDILKSHRERVGQMRKALDDLIQLHNDLRDMKQKVGRLRKEDPTWQSDALQEAAMRTEQLVNQISEIRQANFGAMSHQSVLTLRSQVESFEPVTG